MTVTMLHIAINIIYEQLQAHVNLSESRFTNLCIFVYANF